MDPWKNFGHGTVSVAPSPATTGTTLSISEDDYALLPDPSADGAYDLVIFPSNLPPKADNAEIIRVTAAAAPSGGNVELTITREQQDTTARTIVLGDRFILAWTKKNITDIETEIASQITSSADKDTLYRQSLINGAFDVWQRAVTFTPNDDTYTADRWNFLTETNGAWTIARDTDVPTASGFSYSAKFTNVTLNNQVALVQILENVDTKKIAGQAVSLSFYAKTSGTEISNLRATVLSWSSTADTVTSDVIATWASDGTDPTWATNWTAEVAGSNKALTSSWQRFTIENVLIDTASTANVAVVIWVDDGTIAANDDFWITGVQLNRGTSVAPWTPKPYHQEYVDCLRFCYVPNTVGTTSFIGFGMCLTTAIARITINFPISMRTLPTMTATAADYRLDDTTAATDVTSMDITTEPNWNTTRSANVRANVSGTTLTAQRPISLISDGNANRVMIFEAEL